MQRGGLIPTYNYKCPQCEEGVEIFETIVMHGSKVYSCKQHNLDMEQEINRSTFHFKGTGWYVTDFKDR